MKKLLLFSLLFLSIGTIVFAKPFSPSVLELSAPPSVQYEFDGSTVDIPVTVKGAPASVYFLVFTKDKAETISKIRNGYLGWHYVNKIDTCLYVSEIKQFDIGNNSIRWDGKDDSGNVIPTGDYTYYIFGYDSFNLRVQMSNHITMWAHGHPKIITRDEDNNPLAQPILVNSDRSTNKTAEPTVILSKKWIIGSDPTDESLMETTSCLGWGAIGGSGIDFDPSSYIKYYFYDSLKESNERIIRKWEWVPNGESILQESWGENGRYTFTTAQSAGWSHHTGVVSDGKDWLFTVNGDVSGTGNESELIYLDVEDGTEIKRLDLSDWWVNIADGEAGGQATSGPISVVLKNDKLLMGAHTTCMNTMLDPYYDDESEAFQWVNANGDYTGDHNFEEDSKRPWVCNDYYVGPFKYNVTGDNNLFVAFSSYDLGAVSFGLYAPDGTGMSYHALAGETSAQKYGIEFIDYGSGYDGIYTTNNTTGELDSSWWWVGHDSIAGVITSKVAVEETPKEFTIAQNSPNPFNPITTIGFSIPEAGIVSIDVYNSAGQKVDTIASEFMDSGSHSVVWDASGFSAGVYFYKVKSGELTKTMKMTLLK